MKETRRHRLAALIPSVGDDANRKGWLARLMPKWLTRLPASVDKSDAKIYYTRLGGALLGAILHAFLLGVYGLLDVKPLMVTNLVSCLIFLVAAGLARSGRHFAGTLLSLVEASIHAPLMTHLLGLEAGYLIFNFVVAMALPLVLRDEHRRLRLAIIVYLAISSIVAIVYASWNDPVWVLEKSKLMAVFYLICFSSFGAIVGFSLYFARVSALAEARIARELGRSEQLLLNVLPRAIAERLKTKPETIADNFSEATVLFADIVGFTKLAGATSGTELVDMLNEVFSAFDRIAEKHGLEKIKTIGDAYMVAGGIPVPRADHAEAVVRMALEMTGAVKGTRAHARVPIEIRIGVHTGPVIAGVIGEKKFAYDLWGDTVNIASRMESHGLPSAIQISEATFTHVKELFDCEARGEIEMKGKGRVRTWLVRGAKAQRVAA